MLSAWTRVECRAECACERVRVCLRDVRLHLARTPERIWHIYRPNKQRASNKAPGAHLSLLIYYPYRFGWDLSTAE